MKHILVVVAKAIAYLIVVVCGMFAGLGLVDLFLPNSNMATITQTDLYDWKMLNYQYLGLAIGVVVATLAFRYFVDKKNYQTLGLGLTGIGRNLTIGVLWAVGILLIAFTLVWALGGVTIHQVASLHLAALGYLSWFLLVAIVEEVVFRGYLLQMMTEYLNHIAAILVSSLGFALIHLGNDHFTWIAFANLAFGGILMALLYLKYQSIYAPIGFHWLWNYFQGNILGFGVSGNDVLSMLSISTNEPNWLSGGLFGLEGSIFTCIILTIAIGYMWRGYQYEVVA